MFARKASPVNQAAASVRFHTAGPERTTDVLTGERPDVSEPSSVRVPVRCGLFRFLDIEWSKPPR